MVAAKPPFPSFFLFPSGIHCHGPRDPVSRRAVPPVSCPPEPRYHVARSYNIFDGRRRVREIGLTSVHIGFPPAGRPLPSTLGADKDYRGTGRTDVADDRSSREIWHRTRPAHRRVVEIYCGHGPFLVRTELELG